ncbi:hypothetical protein KAZ01_02505, partial [Candidatus Gracilibacteria bacterium]|nr:hypothetical protein [Candidatus Gracilibacteria bacterium]
LNSPCKNKINKEITRYKFIVIGFLNTGIQKTDIKNYILETESPDSRILSLLDNIIDETKNKTNGIVDKMIDKEGFTKNPNRINPILDLAEEKIIDLLVLYEKYKIFSDENLSDLIIYDEIKAQKIEEEIRKISGIQITDIKEYISLMRDSVELKGLKSKIKTKLLLDTEIPFKNEIFQKLLKLSKKQRCEIRQLISDYKNADHDSNIYDNQGSYYVVYRADIEKLKKCEKGLKGLGISLDENFLKEIIYFLKMEGIIEI